LTVTRKKIANNDNTSNSKADCKYALAHEYALVANKH